MQPSVNETLEIMRIAHEGQVDKAGRPYWEHPLSVCRRLPADATDDERRVALLHDVLEDTPVTARDLAALGFGEAVIEAVKLLTRPKDAGPYLEWIKALSESGNRMAIQVKIADNEDNSDPARVRDAFGVADLVKRYALSLHILRPALATLTSPDTPAPSQ